MALLRPRNQPSGPTLHPTAPHTETDAECIARHRRTCRELAELGMDVARAAARETIGKLEAPIEHPMPGAALPPTCHIADPGRVFARASHAVRQAIALEARIMAGTLHIVHRPHPSPPEQAPRDGAPAGHTSHASFRREPCEPLEIDMIAGENRPIAEAIAAIRQTLGATPRTAAQPAPPLSPVRTPTKAAPLKPGPARPPLARAPSRGTPQSRPPPHPS